MNWIFGKNNNDVVKLMFIVWFLKLPTFKACSRKPRFFFRKRRRFHRQIVLATCGATTGGSHIRPNTTYPVQRRLDHGSIPIMVYTCKCFRWFNYILSACDGNRNVDPSISKHSPSRHIIVCKLIFFCMISVQRITWHISLSRSMTHVGK